jgi:hypothetical protein
VTRRRFLGWEPRRVTTFVYDENGRLEQAITVTEPEWDDEERGWAYAHADLAAEMCPGGCGHPLSESAAVGADDDYRAKSLQCHACGTVARAQEDRNVPGELWRVEKVKSG